MNSVRKGLFKLLDALAGGILAAFLTVIDYWILRRSPRPHPVDPRTLKQILFLRPGGMGDMILLLPAIKRLREEAPQARIDCICESRNAEVLQLSGLVDGIYRYDLEPLRVLKQLCRGRYDLVIDTEQFHYFSAVMAYMTGAAARIGFRINPRRNSLYTHLADYDTNGYEGQQFMNLLRFFGLRDVHHHLRGILSFPNTVLPNDAATWVDMQMKNDRPIVALAPGSTTRYKEWGSERYRELAHRLLDDTKVSIALIGIHSDIPSCGDLLEMAAKENGRVRSFVGELSLTRPPRCSEIQPFCRGRFGGSTSGHSTRHKDYCPFWSQRPPKMGTAGRKSRGGKERPALLALFHFWLSQVLPAYFVHEGTYRPGCACCDKSKTRFSFHHRIVDPRHNVETGAGLKGALRDTRSTRECYRATTE